MLSLRLTTERLQAEWETILAIARNNNFPTKLITKLKTKMQHKTYIKRAKEEKNNKKWATFTFYIPKIRKLTNLFRQTNKQTNTSHSEAQTQYSKVLNPRSRMKTVNTT
jgi:5'-deoxynucleotidase YfbR-like HD superfamily hydrolase